MAAYRVSGRLVARWSRAARGRAEAFAAQGRRRCPRERAVDGFRVNIGEDLLGGRGGAEIGTGVDEFEQKAGGGGPKPIGHELCFSGRLQLANRNGSAHSSRYRRATGRGYHGRATVSAATHGTSQARCSLRQRELHG